MFSETFQKIYSQNIVVISTIDGQKYRIGKNYFPNKKEIILGINLKTTYNQTYKFHIMKTLYDQLSENQTLIGEVKKLNPDCDNELRVFKYTPDRPNFEFVVIMDVDETALTTDEVDWLIGLL